MHATGREAVRHACWTRPVRSGPHAILVGTGAGNLHVLRWRVVTRAVDDHPGTDQSGSGVSIQGGPAQRDVVAIGDLMQEDRQELTMGPWLAYGVRQKRRCIVWSHQVPGQGSCYAPAPYVLVARLA